jgi:hypothetical protein
MEIDVRLGIFVDLRPDAVVVEGREHPPERCDLGVGGALGDQPGSHALERRPDGDHLEDFLLCLADDEGATARDNLDEAFLLQAGDGLADRGTADAEILGKLPLVEPCLTQLGVDVHV